MKHKKYLLKHCASLEGKTVIVTGATGSIGEQICTCCLILGATVIMAVRNIAKAEAVKEKLGKHFPAEKIKIAELDVANPKSIENFNEEADYLINNAGVLGGSLQYETNFLGTMRLTKKYLGKVEKIVFQTSVSYRWKRARTDWANPQAVGVKGSMTRYTRAKRLLNLAVVALDNSKFVLVHPGVCSTNIFPVRAVRAFGRWFFHGARTAALSAVVALSKDVPRTHMLAPRVFGIWGKPVLRKLQKSIFDERELECARQLMANIDSPK